MATANRAKSADIIEQWYGAQGWAPFDFQRAAWSAYLSGYSGLIHAPTGMGKTHAAWLGPVREWLEVHATIDRPPNLEAPPLTVLWVTPLRALARDTVNALNNIGAALELPWTVELRTSDVSYHLRQRQRSQLPTALVTTPESLSLLLSYPDTKRGFRHLRCVIVDEWHELLGTKRGTQIELVLARLRNWTPQIRIWGLSATLGNLDEALSVLMGNSQNHNARLISGELSKKIEIETLIPANVERFPWAGHLGMKLLPQVVERLCSAKSTLIFTNTRAQTELWFQALIDYVAVHAPELIGAIGLHHGSLEPALRHEIEGRIRGGQLRCVVCTSSLDLGVDFAPVEQVMQVGSPKGVARLMQRAGRSGHQPGATSRVVCVPTHAFELVEFAAARDAIERGAIESRRPLHKPLDVLVQHLVTVALGGGFSAATEPWRANNQDEADGNDLAVVAGRLLREVRTAFSYRDLTPQEWQWLLEFVTHGGDALKAYADYARVQLVDGLFRVPSRQIARRHRMSVGTITSDGMLSVQYQSGGSLGMIEEGFVARLKPGDTFVFAGRLLEFRRLKDMTVHVRKARKSKGVVPRWMGGRMPLSSHLAESVRHRLTAANAGRHDTPEMMAVEPILAIQKKWSRIPIEGELLIELLKSREGFHVFLYPLAGHGIHEGLASLLAYRLSQLGPRTISAFSSDYGCELLSPTPMCDDELTWRQLFSRCNLLEDITACLNAAQMSRRQFRDIARIAGLVFSGYPGSRKTTRQVQASSGVIYDVFAQYDPQNLLLDQAQREVLQQQLDISQLDNVLAKIGRAKLVLVEPPRITPLAFPIWASRIRTQVSSETWHDRIERMTVQLEKAAG